MSFDTYSAIGCLIFIFISIITAAVILGFHYGKQTASCHNDIPPISKGQAAASPVVRKTTSRVIRTAFLGPRHVKVWTEIKGNSSSSPDRKNMPAIKEKDQDKYPGS